MSRDRRNSVKGSVDRTAAAADWPVDRPHSTELDRLWAVQGGTPRVWPWQSRRELLLVGLTAGEAAALRQALAEEAVDLVGVQSAIEGIDRFRRRPRALVVLDMGAAGLPWRLAVRGLRAINPVGRIVLCRAARDDATAVLDATDAGFLVLSRPLTTTLLRDLLAC